MLLFTVIRLLPNLWHLRQEINIFLAFGLLRGKGQILLGEKRRT